MGEGTDARAQSSALGVVLVLAIVVTGSTLTLALGAEAFASTNDHLKSDRAAQSMTQLDSQIAMVGLGSSDLQEVELAGGGTDYVVENSSGTMTVSYTNLTSGSETTIFTQEMGAVVYENGDTDIAYQGGGVWRRSEGGGTTMISPPEFHYRDATLTLPLVTVSGDESLYSSAVVRANNSTRYFPNRTMDAEFQNPLQGSRVDVTVESEYYEAWGEYFEERTDGEVSYDHGAQTVTIQLVSPVERPRVSSASASMSASGTFILSGRAFTDDCNDIDVYTDSYNSSGTTDGYCAQEDDGALGTNGDIVYGDDIDISLGTGTSNIRGDVMSGGAVTVAGGNGAGQVNVYGNINYTDSCQASNGNGNGNNGGNNDEICEDRIVSGSGGSANQISGIETTGSLTSTVVDQVDRLSDDANNSNDDVGGVIGVSDLLLGNGELDDGSYYFEDLELSSGERLELDTTDGNITIGVRGEIDLANDAEIEVTGDGIVRVYAIGAGGHTTDLSLGDDARIHNDGDDAPQFRLYGPSNYTARIGAGGGDDDLATFTGVIYAPPGTTSSANAGSVDVNGGEVYGGVVTGTTTIDKGSIHYDEALANERMVGGDTNIVRVTYLHVSTNGVIVESG